uniref:Uncharacterized protein n=1 Tax=Arundo donax TaxID=35708 RepID=A0A0A8ZH88_ARUDO
MKCTVIRWMCHLTKFQHIVEVMSQQSMDGYNLHDVEVQASGDPAYVTEGVEELPQLDQNLQARLEKKWLCYVWGFLIFLNVT